MSASLQNSVRLRVFLIVVVSIGVRVARAYASVPVHKASGILETNLFLYGLVLMSSLVPVKTVWLLTAIAQLVITVLNCGALALGVIATSRCASQVGCVQTLPMSIATLVLIALVTLLDLLQTWTVYRILQNPVFVAKPLQRVRILFAWAAPFAWLANGSLFWKATWSIWVTPHLVIDPLIIIMANSGENVLLVVFMVGLVMADTVSMVFVRVSFNNTIVYVQLALELTALFMLWVSDAPSEVVSVTPTVLLPTATPTVVKEMSASLYQRKSSKKSTDKVLKF